MAEGATSTLWGPVMSTAGWCEKNYTHSSYIAEFYNTISNVPCILFAFVGLYNALGQKFEKRFSVIHLSNITIAIGSMFSHATLRNTHEWSNETPMVLEMLLYLYILYSPDWHYRSTMPLFLFVYGIGFAVFHSQAQLKIGFIVHYVVICLLCIPRMYKYYIHTKELSAQRLVHLYAATLSLGSLCWLVDRTFCKEISKWYINPQGHALWHVFMGFSSYCANTFLMFCRAQQLGWNTRICYLVYLPYVQIDKPKKQ